MNLGTLTELMMGPPPTTLNEMKEYHEMFDKVMKPAMEDFSRRKVGQIIKMKYDAGTLGEKYVKIKEYEDACRSDLQEVVAKNHNNGYVFITINPKESVKFADFRQKVEKYVNRNMFTEYRYVYEQRGKNTEEQGKGFHAHILCKRNLDYKPSKIVQNSKNTFKGVCNVEAFHLLNIQHIGVDFAKDKDKYMTGIKTGVSEDGTPKEIKQEIDILWRKAENIESVYGKEFQFN